ncbi:glycosyltransferase family 2 protein [Bacteroidota bacterium]
MQQKVRVIIPAYNEERSISKVISEIPKNLIEEVIVVNNGSCDQTANTAEKAGATVITEQKKGYGYACLEGMSHIRLNSNEETDIIVFIDGDYSDYPDEMGKIIDPIINEEADMVIGSRALGNRERGSMTPQQVFGNWLSTKLLKWMYGVIFTDLGPFRAIRWNSLENMKMEDKTFGWTVEMQLKAAKMGLRCTEVPVSYRKRIGKSKVSGTLKGTIMAGYKILWTIFKYK